MTQGLRTIRTGERVRFLGHAPGYARYLIRLDLPDIALLPVTQPHRHRGPPPPATRRRCARGKCPANLRERQNGGGEKEQNACP